MILLLIKTYQDYLVTTVDGITIQGSRIIKQLLSKDQSLMFYWTRGPKKQPLFNPKNSFFGINNFGQNPVRRDDKVDVNGN